MIRSLNLAATPATIAFSLLLAGSAQAGSWQNRAPFGATLQGDLFTPTTPADSPAILVALHFCTGNSGSAHGWFDSYADANGFYVVAPDAGKQCFESSATRGGDREAVVTMVQYVIDTLGGNPDRVFAAGFSSGGCMTNTLLAIYPDVFKGGAAMPGFTAGGWPAGDTTCTRCGSNPPSTDGQYWGDIARTAFAWDGKYPCSQQWVGGADEYNFQGWLPAVAAQFQNLGDLGEGSPGDGAPNGWQRTVYKDSDGHVRLETNVLPGQAHDLTGQSLPGHVVSFLGLDQPTGACGIAEAGAGGAGTGGADGVDDMSAGTGGADGVDDMSAGTGGMGGVDDMSAGMGAAGTVGADDGSAGMGAAGTVGADDGSAGMGAAGMGGVDNVSMGAAGMGGADDGSAGMGAAGRASAGMGTVAGSAGAGTSAGAPGSDIGTAGSAAGAASSAAGSDAASASDVAGGVAASGSVVDATSDDAGCSCTTAGRQTGTSRYGLLALGLAALVMRRRRECR